MTVDSTRTSRADELIALLDLRPHPEGGFYREVFRSASRITTGDARGVRAALTTIYFLLPGGTHSRWHQVDSDEVWHFYEGDPLELLELDAAGQSLVRHRLGAVDGTGQLPVHTIPAGSLAGGATARRVHARRMHRRPGIRLRRLPHARR